MSRVSRVSGVRSVPRSVKKWVPQVSIFETWERKPITGGMQRILAAIMVLAIAMPVSQPLHAQNPAPASSAPDQNSQNQQDGFVMKVNAELVLTNVVARDRKTGQLVRGLKQSDFSI